MLPLDIARRFNLPELNVSTTPVSIVQTLNPISQEMAALRPNLLPGVLQVMGFNQNHGQRLLRFMEFGHVFARVGTDQPTTIPGYAEHESFIIAVSGPQHEAGWDVQERFIDPFDLKGTIVSLFQALHLPQVTMTPVYETSLVTSYHMDIYTGKTRLGMLARLNDNVAETYDLKSPVLFAELDWNAIVPLASSQIQRKYKTVSRFPVVERDLAVTLERDQAVGPLLNTIRSTGSKLLQHVSVFDLYQDKRVGKGKKSIAFKLRFGADRTLKDKEVDKHISRILIRLKNDYGAELRQ